MATLTRWKIWIRMIFGKSDLHLNQLVGGFIVPEKLSGYYNDMSEKVTFNKKTVKSIDYLPIFTNDYGQKVVFPIQIIQYALGCYELYLKTKETLYLEKMIYCSNHILSLINDDGSISCMYFVKELNNPYSSMCQGECISLLARVYKETHEKKYFDAAMKAYTFLVNKKHPLAVAKEYNGLDYCLFEYPEKEIVLNGYIFSLFGLYDAYLMTKDDNIKAIFWKSLDSLSKIIDKFDLNGWTYYDLDKHYSSKFYHKLHVDLLAALNLIANGRFAVLKEKWESGLKNKILCRKMFWKKAKQKLSKEK